LLKSTVAGSIMFEAKENVKKSPQIFWKRGGEGVFGFELAEFCGLKEMGDAATKQIYKIVVKSNMHNMPIKSLRNFTKNVLKQ